MLNTAYATNGRSRIGNGIGALVAWSHSELSASRSITEAACNHADSRLRWLWSRVPQSLQVRDEG